jgi:hypothetical protein
MVSMVAETKKLAVVVACLAVCWVVFHLISQWTDRRINSWSYGTPSLIGDWQGDGWAGNTRLKLVLSLGRGRGDREGPTLIGRALLCDPTGRVGSYPEVRGHVDRRGRRSELFLGPHDYTFTGLWLATPIKLSWDGGTTLGVQARLIRVDTQGRPIGSSSDPAIEQPIPFLLGACGRPRFRIRRRNRPRHQASVKTLPRCVQW